MKKHILEGMAEVYMFNCLHCGLSFSRDEVTEVKDERKFTHYICDKCMDMLRLAGEKP